MLRDGRRVEHDLGPRRTIEFSLMKIAAGYGEEATGGWTRDSHASLFSKPTRPRLTDDQRRAATSERQREYRLGDIERQRSLERARAARYRARKAAAA